MRCFTIIICTGAILFLEGSKHVSLQSLDSLLVDVLSYKCIIDFLWLYVFFKHRGFSCFYCLSFYAENHFTGWGVGIAIFWALSRMMIRSKLHIPTVSLSDYSVVPLCCLLHLRIWSHLWSLFNVSFYFLFETFSTLTVDVVIVAKWIILVT